MSRIGQLLRAGGLAPDPAFTNDTQAVPDRDWMSKGSLQPERETFDRFMNYHMDDCAIASVP